MVCAILQRCPGSPLNSHNPCRSHSLLPRPHLAFKPCNLGNCRAMYWCFKALRSSPCQVLFGIKQLYSVPRGSRMTMRIFKSFPKTGCGIKCLAERKPSTVYFKQRKLIITPKQIFHYQFRSNHFVKDS